MNNIEQALPKMRTIRETAEITKPLGVSEFMLRRLVREKKIVYVLVGNRVLINLDKLIEFLNRGEQL